ncbi:hypothetical protein B0H17DRAFT_1210339 [Mycena rosella]|uniref:Uncharacterized protein n=1 Tax=Mycena rosella TaxID=1033263 RepID=A0AAD7CWG8_MYCRO|nr:hypothetical protein B0H17DRAFT_1210339 [Mycena rosella]
MACQFSFGPNLSYFCSAGSVFAWSDISLPAGLVRLLQNPNHPQALDTPYDVAFPMEPGAYAICWKTNKGEDWYEDGCLGPNYARLARFIKSVATTGQHTSRTVFGPGASYFSISPSGYSWQNLPPALEEDIHNCIKTRRPTTVALGVQGSYVVLYNDGTVTFDLRGQYPLVEALIRNTSETSRRRGVMYVALNPHAAGQYYAVYADATASWNLPTAWGPDVTAISQEIKPVPIPAAAEPAALVAPGGTGPAQGAQVVQPVQVAPGGTALAQVTSPTRAGGTDGNILSSVGHAIQAVAHEISPDPPAYAPVAHVSPAHVAQSPPPPGSTSPAPHKINWQEGLAMGLKAAQGINKIVNVIEHLEEGSDQQQQPDQNSFNFANMQGLFDQVGVQQTTFDNTTTWQANS